MSIVSVVIASAAGSPFIDECLLSLECQARALEAEVIVVTCAGGDIARKFPWVRVINRAARETIPRMRQCGAGQARGRIVAIIEERCLAAGDWLHEALQAHASGDYGAVGGPVAYSPFQRLRDWMVYFCEYHSALPPAPRGEVGELNGANIAYKRQVLMDHSHLLGQGYWEAALDPALLAKGIRFLSAPDMVVYKRGPFPYVWYLKQRYWFSRAFAGNRRHDVPALRRAAYALLAPVIPLLLLARIARRVWRKRCRVAKFIQAIPLMMPALILYAAGEWMGYVAGPGDALLKVE